MKKNKNLQSSKKSSVRAIPKMKEKNYDISTYLVHGESVSPAWDYSHHTIPPMSASVTYRLDSAERGACGFSDFASAASHKKDPIFIYDRLDEPTRSMLETRLAQLEGGAICTAFSTGMAAISAALGVCLKAGDHVISHYPIYGCSFSLLNLWLPRLGIHVDFINLNDTQKLKSILRDNTQVIYLESPVNPTLEMIDLTEIRKIADFENKKRAQNDRKIQMIVDNTFATPYGQRPIEFGADLVCHSLTKNIAGFGTDMGGAVIARTSDLEGELLVWRKDFGAALASRSAWSILVYGLPTLPLRLEQQSQSAMKIAQWLEGRSEIANVQYPGLKSFKQYALAQKQLRSPSGKFISGNMIYFEMKEKGKDLSKNSKKLVNWVAKNSYAITLAVSLGQLRTLIENPGSMTHSSLTADKTIGHRVSPSGIRLSIGIEDPKDIIRDLEEALNHL